MCDEVTRFEEVQVQLNTYPSPVCEEPKRWRVGVPRKIYNDAKMKNVKVRIDHLITEEHICHIREYALDVSVVIVLFED